MVVDGGGGGKGGSGSSSAAGSVVAESVSLITTTQEDEVEEAALSEEEEVEMVEMVVDGGGGGTGDSGSADGILDISGGGGAGEDNISHIKKRRPIYTTSSSESDESVTLRVSPGGIKRRKSSHVAEAATLTTPVEIEAQKSRNKTRAIGSLNKKNLKNVPILHFPKKFPKSPESPKSPTLAAAKAKLLPPSMAVILTDLWNGVTEVPVHIPQPTAESLGVVSIIAQTNKKTQKKGKKGKKTKEETTEVPAEVKVPAVVKNPALEDLVQNFNLRIKQQLYHAEVVTEFGVHNKGTKAKCAAEAKFEIQAFKQFRFLLSTMKVKFDHSLVRVDGNGSCYTYSTLASILLSRYYFNNSAYARRITAQQLKVMVAKEMLENPHKLTDDKVAFIDCWLRHEDPEWIAAYPKGSFAVMSELEKDELLADYRHMCATYPKVEQYNSELISLVTARLLGLRMHQFSQSLQTWVVFNEGENMPPRHDVFLMNNGCHYWTWIHNSEIRNQGVVLFPSPLDKQKYNLTKIVCDFTNEQVEPITEPIFPAKRLPERQLRYLGNAYAEAERKLCESRKVKRRWHLHHMLCFVLSHVGGLLSDTEKNGLTQAEQVERVFERGKDWKKEVKSLHGYWGAFNEEVFKDVFCQGVLAFTI
jgi:hypothetical protein